MDNKIEVNIEELIRIQVAQKIIETIPEEERKKILEVSLTKTLQDILKSWNVEKAIRDDVNRYMVDYLKKPEVQKRVKDATEKSVDKLMKGVINVIIEEAQDGIKSEYKSFLKKEEKDDDYNDGVI